MKNTVKIIMVIAFLFAMAACEKRTIVESADVQKTRSFTVSTDNQKVEKITIDDGLLIVHYADSCKFIEM